MTFFTAGTFLSGFKTILCKNAVNIVRQEFFGLLWSPTLWFYIITLQCTVCYVVWLPAGDDQMEFSWMWYLDWILDGCYYPRVIGHFKKLYFDQQVYLAVTVFHGGIPPKKIATNFLQPYQIWIFQLQCGPSICMQKVF